MLRFRTSRCLLVACLRHTEGKKRETKEEGCCASCHERHSNRPMWTQKLSMTGFSSIDPPYPVSLTEDTAVTARRNDKHTIKDPPAEDEEKATTDACKKDRLKRFDWREHGAVTPVRRQKECGCCFAVSTSGSTEGLGKITTGFLEQYSVQQIIDCDLNSRNDGCYGGYASTAFKYIMEFGLTTEKLYPMTSHKNFREKRKYEAVHKRFKRCRKVDPNSLVYISGFQHVDPNDDALEAAVLINPVIVTVEPDDTFRRYGGGIITTWECPPPTESQVHSYDFTVHHLLLVGFDETDWGFRYWIAKNSWGEEWGEDGYCTIQRDNPGEPWGVLGIMAWSGIYPTGFHRRPVPPSPASPIRSWFSSLGNLSLWRTTESVLCLEASPDEKVGLPSTSVENLASASSLLSSLGNFSLWRSESRLDLEASLEEKIDVPSTCFENPASASNSWFSPLDNLCLWRSSESHLGLEASLDERIDVPTANLENPASVSNSWHSPLDKFLPGVLHPNDQTLVSHAIGLRRTSFRTLASRLLFASPSCSTALVRHGLAIALDV